VRPHAFADRAVEGRERIDHGLQDLEPLVPRLPLGHPDAAHRESGIGLGESAGGWEVDVGEFTANRVWETGSSSDPRDLYRRIPFSGVLAWAVAPDAIHLADLEDYEIRVYEGRGRLSRILREDAEPPPVTAAHREAYLAEQEALDRPHPEGVPFPDRFGSYETFVVSHEGDLWARRVTPSEVEGAKWEVFPGDGGPLRRVILPDITVESVRDGRVYGHRSDSLGIQTVVVLDAERGSGSGTCPGPHGGP